MATGNVNYSALYFKYKNPMPIIGIPTNKSLKRIKQELQANLGSVESDLGGGDHGYLGLILHNKEYALSSNLSFKAPQYPQPLQILLGTNPVEASNLCKQHKEQ